MSSKHQRVLNNLQRLTSAEKCNQLYQGVNGEENFIGAGKVGKVFSFHDHVVKVYNLDDYEDQYENEITALKILRDSGIAPKLIMHHKCDSRLPTILQRILKFIRERGTMRCGFIVMERIQGTTLSQALEKVKNNYVARDQFLDNILPQLKLQLTALHQTGLYHRDLHNKNIMIDVSLGIPIVKLIDFGSSYSSTNQAQKPTRQDVQFLTEGDFVQLAFELCESGSVSFAAYKKYLDSSILPMFLIEQWISQDHKRSIREGSDKSHIKNTRVNNKKRVLSAGLNEPHLKSKYPRK